MTKFTVEGVVYLLVFILCVIVLMLASLSQSFNADTHLIYQGF